VKLTPCPLSSIVSVVIVFAVIPAPRALAMPGLLTADDPARAEIVAAASAFLTVLADGDVGGAKSRFAGDAEQAKLLDAHLEWVTSAERLRKAVTPTLDKEGLLRDLRVAESIRRRTDALSERIIFMRGDRASLSVGGGLDLGMRLRRQDGKWLVTHLVARPAQTAPLIEAVRAMATVVKRAETDLNAGKIKERDDLGLALMSGATAAFSTWVLADIATMARAPADAPARWNTPSAADLSKLPGAAVPSDGLDRLLDALPGLICTAGTPETLTLFDDEGGVSITTRYKAPLVVSRIELFAKGAEGYAAYPGELPHGLALTDTRLAVEKKLGRPPRCAGGGDSDRTFLAFYPTLGLQVHYRLPSGRDPDNPIHHLTLITPDPRGDAPIPWTDEPKRRLEFRLVARSSPSNDGPADLLPDPTDPAKTPVPVQREVLLDESAFARATATGEAPDYKKLAISLRATPEGAKRMESLSKANVNRRLAIVLDGRVIIMPNISGPMSEHLLITLGDAAETDTLREDAFRINAAINALRPAAGIKPKAD
jgi:hypothetical protein